MKRLLTVALWAALSCLVLAPMARAADGDGPKPPAPPPAPKEGDGPRPGQPGPGDRGGPLKMIQDILGKLTLTADQTTAIKELTDKFQADMKANFEKNADAIKALQEKMLAAKAAKDEAAMKELRQQVQKLMPPMEAKIKELTDQIKSSLTDEQKAAFDKAVAEARKQGSPPPPMRPGAVVELVLNNPDKVGLTDEQKTKLQGLLDTFRDAMKKLGDGATEKDRRDLGDKLLADAKAVLDQPGQLEKVKALLEANRPGPGGPGERLQRVLGQLTLTDDQKKAVGDLVTAFQASMKDAKPEDRPGLVKKLITDVRAVLTADQQTKFDELMKEGPKPPPGDGPKPPPPGDGPKAGPRDGPKPPPAPPLSPTRPPGKDGGRR